MKIFFNHDDVPYLFLIITITSDASSTITNETVCNPGPSSIMSQHVTIRKKRKGIHKSCHLIINK